MSSAVRTRPLALVTIPLFFAMVIVAAQLVTSGPGISQPPRHAPPTARQSERAALREAAAAMAATIVKPITPAQPVPAPAATTTTTRPPAPPPDATPAPAAGARPRPHADPAPPPRRRPHPHAAPIDPGLVPPVGQATAWGCAAAVAYLQVYAARGFSIECPGYAEGREAMTCTNQPGVCPGTSVIAIADPCPQAYMNEASNSLVLMGLSDAPIDPFGACP